MEYFYNDKSIFTVTIAIMPTLVLLLQCLHLYYYYNAYTSTVTEMLTIVTEMLTIVENVFQQNIDLIFFFIKFKSFKQSN